MKEQSTLCKGTAWANREVWLCHQMEELPLRGSNGPRGILGWPQRERQTCGPEAGQAGGQLAGKQLCRKGPGVPAGPKAEQEPAVCPHSTGLPPNPAALLGHPSAPTWAGLPGQRDLNLLDRGRHAEVRKGLEH